MKISSALASALLVTAGCGGADATGIESDAPLSARVPNDVPFPNASGSSATFSANGFVDLQNAFFQDLGTNGRRCVTCHDPAEGWSISPAGVELRFLATRGRDPIFRTVDGSNSPVADVSTFAARRDAYSMLRTRGVIRIGIGIPANAEFELAAADDPYGHASASELSLFRRPLPTTNLKFLSAIMWDGREMSLATQANDATLGHAQASVELTQAQRDSIVAFETALFTAQVRDRDAGPLDALSARGGAETLFEQEFYLGINDNLGDARTGAAFSPIVFDLFDGWSGLSHGPRASARAAVARGQALFNTRAIDIRGVKGLNDNPYFGSPLEVIGTCTTCHDAPNAGNHSLPIPLDIGIADGPRRTPDLPLYTLRNKATGDTVTTTDPGRAMISGRWADIGRFKGPILHALAARAPYFHNGSASTLEAVLDFYDGRFEMNLTPAERADLTAFLRAL